LRQAPSARDRRHARRPSRLPHAERRAQASAALAAPASVLENYAPEAQCFTVPH